MAAFRSQNHPLKKKETRGWIAPLGTINLSEKVRPQLKAASKHSPGCQLQPAPGSIEVHQFCWLEITLLKWNSFPRTLPVATVWHTRWGDAFFVHFLPRLLSYLLFWFRETWWSLTCFDVQTNFKIFYTVQSKGRDKQKGDFQDFFHAFSAIYLTP